MRHATPETLDALEPLLVQLRELDGLRERSRGTFYRRSQAFLHFHEDPAGIFADLKEDGRWERYPVARASQRRALLARVRAAASV